MTDIFISYSHKDEAWKEALQRHLKVLQAHNEFSIWDDRQIEVGANWLPAIENAIEQAKVALLLVSSDFLTSEFVTRKEIPRFLQRREAEGLQVVPIIIRPCAWMTVPWLADLQGVTKDNRPLAQFILGSFESEQAFSEITLKVYELLQAAKQTEEAKRLANLAKQAEQQRLEQERLNRQAEQQRLAQEQAEREAAERVRQAELQTQQERAEQAQREQLAQEQAKAAERARLEQIQREQAAAAQAEKKRIAQEQAELKRQKREEQKTQGGLNPVKWWWGGVGVTALVSVVAWKMQGSTPAASLAPQPTEVVLSLTAPTSTQAPVAEPTKPIIPLPEMIKIEAGSFEMGCSNGKDCEANEEPVHMVTVPSFEMSKTEVTFAEWDACVEDGGCGGYQPDDQQWGRDNRPVINVSWKDAQNYVQWLSQKTGLTYRLPTEAEWEYAARAGTKTSYFWGDNIGKNKANCDECGSQWDSQQTAPVASFPANSWGLVDMHGNVWEWTQDCYHDGYKGAPEDGSAWLEKNCEYHVLRGGSWNYRPRNLRSANRSWFGPTVRYVNIGFRISRTL